MSFYSSLLLYRFFSNYCYLFWFFLTFMTRQKIDDVTGWEKKTTVAEWYFIYTAIWSMIEIHLSLNLMESFLFFDQSKILWFFEHHQDDARCKNSALVHSEITNDQSGCELLLFVVIQHLQQTSQFLNWNRQWEKSLSFLFLMYSMINDEITLRMHTLDN